LITETEVRPSAGAAPESARQTAEWQERERLAAAMQWKIRNELRTRARGFDD
jgi:hypothetical protein